MSSTSRGGLRNEADNYPTPGWCVRRFLEARPDITKGQIIEPCAGDGAIIQQLGVPAHRMTAIELRNSWDVVMKLTAMAGTVKTNTNFLGWSSGLGSGPPFPFDASISNPPFSIALEVILASLNIAARVAMLLRLNFVGGQERSRWMRSHMPNTYVLPDRPSFRADGQTDSIEYAWFVWEHNAIIKDNSRGELVLLRETPLAERKEDHAICFGTAPEKFEPAQGSLWT